MPSRHVRFASTNTVHSPHTPALTVSAFSPASSSHSALLTPPSSHSSVLPGPMPMGYPVSFHAHSPRAAKPTRLHPLLQSSSSPLLNFDLRQSPSTITSHYKGISLRGFTEPATQPPLPSITIVSPHLPWTATVYPSRHGTYVTVGDVIDELHHFLRKQISAKEWNSLPSEKDRRRVTDAYERRYRRISSSRDYDDEKTRGVRRVDFLMGLNKFMGLAPSAEGPGVLVFHSRE